MDQLNFFAQLFLSLILGGLIGWQRERWSKPAGIRTYALVTAGATLFTLLSRYGFGTDSPARLASQIVVGIGFIGAGTILHKSDHIEGLTTAAGLWISAAIGMAIAVEWYILAILTTLLVLALLIVDEKKWFIQKNVSIASKTMPLHPVIRAHKAHATSSVSKNSARIKKPLTATR